MLFVINSHLFVVTIGLFLVISMTLPALPGLLLNYLQGMFQCLFINFLAGGFLWTLMFFKLSLTNLLLLYHLLLFAWFLHLDLNFLGNHLYSKNDIINLESFFVTDGDLELLFRWPHKCPKLGLTVFDVIIISNSLDCGMISRHSDISDSKHCVSSPSNHYSFITVTIDYSSYRIVFLGDIDQHNMFFRQLNREQVIQLLVIFEVLRKLFQTYLAFHLL